MGELFDSIIWYIQYKPIPENIQIKQYNIDGHPISPRDITPEELDTVLFQHDIHITYPLSDNLSVVSFTVLAGPVTVKSLFNDIWNYYQQPMNPMYYSRIFRKNPDLEEEVLDNYNGDKTQIINLDTFSTYPSPPNFVGLSLQKNGSYMVDLGPI